MISSNLPIRDGGRLFTPSRLSTGSCPSRAARHRLPGAYPFSRGLFRFRGTTGHVRTVSGWVCTVRRAGHLAQRWNRHGGERRPTVKKLLSVGRRRRVDCNPSCSAVCSVHAALPYPPAAADTAVKNVEHHPLGATLAVRGRVTTLPKYRIFLKICACPFIPCRAISLVQRVGLRRFRRSCICPRG